MKSIAINRLNLIPMPAGSGISNKNKLILLAELAGMGYRVTNPELLNQGSNSMFLDHPELIRVLKQRKGGNVDYVPLFSGFPNKAPDDATYFLNRIMGFIGNMTGIFREGKQLESGVTVPEWLFDLEQFGADPITQFQSEELWQKAREREAAKQDSKHVEWIELELVFTEDLPNRLQGWLQSNLYAKSSIKAALHEDIKLLLRFFESLDFSRITQKENRALVLSTLWKEGLLDRVQSLIDTPTDILRMFAALTDTDVSLATKARTN